MRKQPNSGVGDGVQGLPGGGVLHHQLAQRGPIQASMLLYLIDRESAEQRPVELIIEGEDGPATVELDL